MTKTLKGVYTLLIRLDRPQTITIGKRRRISFASGYYAYVGSALNSLEARIARHLEKNKNLHWHIDYFLQKARVVEIISCATEENSECTIASHLAQTLEPVPHFGSSDCHCQSHFFYYKNKGVLRAVVRRSCKKSDLVPKAW